MNAPSAPMGPPWIRPEIQQKVAFRDGATLEQVTAATDALERAVRAAVPSARVIYIEPGLAAAPAVTESELSAER